MTVLYHGTNVRFEMPDVDAGREGMDFGKGFYLTPSLDTARKQADRVVAYAGGSPVVLAFEFDEDAARRDGAIRDYPLLDRTWVHFVMANRLGDESAADHNLDRRYPIVHGHVADDRLMQILDDYENGDLTIEEVEQKLITAQFKAFQYSFHVPSAIKYLHSKGEVK